MQGALAKGGREPLEIGGVGRRDQVRVVRSSNVPMGLHGSLAHRQRQFLAGHLMTLVGQHREVHERRQQALDAIRLASVEA